MMYCKSQFAEELEMAHRMVETVTISMQVSMGDWSRSGSHLSR